MKHSHFTFTNKDGLELFARGWHKGLNDDNDKGIIYLIHGLGEHSGRYDHVAEALTGAGYQVFGFDLRGHGLSQGKRGYTPSFDHLLDDMHTFIEEVNERYTFSCPSFLYGHSLGANLVINFALRRPIDGINGVIATSPSLKLAMQPPIAKLFLAKVMADLMPAFTLSSELDPAHLSRDQAIVKAYRDDVYVHDRLSARLAMDIIESGQYGLDNVENWQIPLLLMHGTEDKICDFEATKTFADKGNGYIRFIPCEDCYHEIHNEPGKEAHIAVMISWLNQHSN